MKSKKIRDAARGEECTVELHPYCCGDPATTVLAHAPSPRKGGSIKSPDWWGAHACSICHDIVDGRRKTDLSSEEIHRCLMRGVFRTMERLIEEGHIVIKSR